MPGASAEARWAIASMFVRKSCLVGVQSERSNSTESPKPALIHQHVNRSGLVGYLPEQPFDVALARQVHEIVVHAKEEWAHGEVHT